VGWTAGVRFQAKASDFSIQQVPEAISLELKQPGCEANRSPPSSEELNNGGAVPPLLHASSWRNA
jgi:hypothetical protein